MLNRALTTVDKINAWVARVVKYFVYIIIAAMTFEIIARYVFNRPTIWADELAQMFFGSYFILAGAIALLEHAHVNMDLFYNKLSTRGKAILDIATSPLFFLFAGVLLWQGGNLWWRSMASLQRSESVWHPPIYPYKFMIPLGVGLVLLQGLVKLVRDIMAVAARREAK